MHFNVEITHIHPITNKMFLDLLKRNIVLARSDAWKKFVKARTDYGLTSVLTALAWRDYSSVNIEYRNFSFSRQCEIETNLICNQSNKTDLFHKYIRRKKKVNPQLDLSKMRIV